MRSPPPMGGVAKMEFTTARLAQVRTSHASETCVWSGVVVPYERTWPEVQSGFIEDKVLAPEPGKVAGYALVVNQQACPGQAPESMFRISEFKKPSRNGSFLYGRPTVSQLVSSIKPDERPKWLEQVMATVDKAAASGNPDAVAFREITAKAVAAAPVAN